MSDLDRKLSTLEFTVLGIVNKKGPCTGYSVLQEFSGSKSGYYRSGAGSIYPILKRLVKAGLLESAPDKRLGITPEGIAALREWFSPDDASCSLDSIRSRLYFLAALAPSERLEWVEAQLSSLRRLLDACRAEVDDYRSYDFFSGLAMQGTVAETQSRILWLEGVRNELEAREG
jgi:DNA-binding PadR family transcriptional regulator